MRTSWSARLCRSAENSSTCSVSVRVSELPSSARLAMARGASILQPACSHAQSQAGSVAGQRAASMSRMRPGHLAGGGHDQQQQRDAQHRAHPRLAPARAALGLAQEAGILALVDERHFRRRGPVADGRASSSARAASRRRLRAASTRAWAGRRVRPRRRRRRPAGWASSSRRCRATARVPSRAYGSGVGSVTGAGGSAPAAPRTAGASSAALGACGRLDRRDQRRRHGAGGPAS